MNLDSQKNPRAPVAVVGAGNWLISCDRVGPKVLQMCRNRFGPEVELLDTGSSSLNLLDIIDNQALLLIVDASIGSGDGGRIRIVEPDLNLVDDAAGSGSHQINPLETLMIANSLYPDRLPRKILMILVETNGINEIEMEHLCRKVVCIIEKKVEQYWTDSWSRGYRCTCKNGTVC